MTRMLVSTHVQPELRRMEQTTLWPNLITHKTRGERFFCSNRHPQRAAPPPPEAGHLDHQHALVTQQAPAESQAPTSVCPWFPQTWQTSGLSAEVMAKTNQTVPTNTSTYAKGSRGEPQEERGSDLTESAQGMGAQRGNRPKSQGCNSFGKVRA